MLYIERDRCGGLRIYSYHFRDYSKMIGVNLKIAWAKESKT